VLFYDTSSFDYMDSVRWQHYQPLRVWVAHHWMLCRLG